MGISSIHILYAFLKKPVIICLPGKYFFKRERKWGYVLRVQLFTEAADHTEAGATGGYEFPGVDV